MIKIYGRSDSETTFLDKVNSRFKEFKVESIDEFTDYKNNPSKPKLERIQEAENRASQLKKEIGYLKHENARNWEKTKNITFELRKKFRAIGKTYGQLREEIQAEIDTLKSRQERLIRTIDLTKDSIAKKASELKNITYERIPSLKRNFYYNEQELGRITKDVSMMRLLTGAHGENSVIDMIKDRFGNYKNTYLINSFDLDIKEKAIHIQDKTLKLSKIDHVLILDKGIFLIETKAWANPTLELEREVEEQMERFRRVFLEKFDKKVNEKTTYLVVYTKKEPRLKGEKVVRVDQLDKLIESQEPKLSNDEIVEIMNLFLPDISETSRADIMKWKTKKAIVNIKRIFKRK